MGYFNIAYDLLKNEFIIKKGENEIGRVKRVSVMFAVNECLCNSGNTITLLKDGLPVAYIKRKTIEKSEEQND